MMLRIIIYFLIVFCLSGACKKDTIVKAPVPTPTPKKPTVKFVFVNRNGFRSDSVNYGNTYMAFQGPCIDSKFYNKSLNHSWLANTCYNRNNAPDNYPTQDSVLFREYEYSDGSEVAFSIEMRWWLRYTADQSGVPGSNNGRIVTYTTKNWPNGDTIKIARDTIIKFIWPIDTASGKYMKTYQYP